MEPTCNQFPRLSRDPSNFNLGNRLEISFESKLTIPTCIVTPPNSLDDYRVSLEESNLLLLFLLLRLTDNNEIAIKFLMRRRIEEGEKDRRFDLFGDRWIYIRRDRERERDDDGSDTFGLQTMFRIQNHSVDRSTRASLWNEVERFPRFLLRFYSKYRRGIGIVECAEQAC